MILDQGSDRGYLLSRARGIAALAYYLGPWIDESRHPGSVSATEAPLGNGQTARLYTPRRTSEGVVLLIHGLHFLGPFDPRIDRFARVLAASGKTVVAPYLETYKKMFVRPSVLGDAEAALEYATELAAPRATVGVMSISFGSLPALYLAGDERYREHISSMILFGGYAHFNETIRFCIHGDSDHPHDPLNRPAVYINLLPFMDHVSEEDGDMLREAWLAFMHRTWGRTEMKSPDRFRPIAREIANEMPKSLRELFLRGCEARPGGETSVDDALERARDFFAFADLDQYARRVTCPVAVVHGESDDVIPASQAPLLTRLLANADEPYITGLYHHSGKDSLVEAMARGRAMVNELLTLVRVLRKLDSLGR